MFGTYNAQSVQPDGVPVLQAGSHSGPDQGGCVMEIASLLAGERWSDHPRCAHPVLGELARGVNDRLTYNSRQQLLAWVPRIVGTGRRHPLLTASLARVLARHGLRVCSHDPDLRWIAKHARMRTEAWETGRWWSRVWLQASDPAFCADGAYRRIVPVLDALAGTDGDTALMAVLSEAVTAYHQTVQRIQDVQPYPCPRRCSVEVLTGT